MIPSLKDLYHSLTDIWLLLSHSRPPFCPINPKWSFTQYHMCFLVSDPEFTFFIWHFLLHFLLHFITFFITFYFIFYIASKTKMSLSSLNWQLSFKSHRRIMHIHQHGSNKSIKGNWVHYKDSSIFSRASLLSKYHHTEILCRLYKNSFLTLNLCHRICYI